MTRQEIPFYKLYWKPMTKTIKYRAMWKGWELILFFVALFRRGIKIGFQRLRNFVCNCSTIVTPKKALFDVISLLLDLVITYSQILLESCKKHLGHFMMYIPYTLGFSQCSQRSSEWKVVDVSGLLLFVSSLSFSVALSLSWVCSSSLPFTEAIYSPSSSLSDELSTLLSFSKVLFFFGSLFLFLLNRVATLCSW